MCFSPTGEMLWQHSMMESFGRMTFPNGRTATPVVDGDLVITHGITANWGADGPARDRFYAFDTRTGELVWYSTPGGQPKDSSYAPPTLAWWKGQRVFYCGTGDGSIVAVNARNGKPLWSVKISQGGVNTQVLMHKDKLIAIHGSENLDNSEIGRMIAVRVPTELPPLGTNTSVIFNMKDVEVWRND
jgi:outer membrane protein assembly factor BamB